jgi:protein SCO1/2
VPVLSPWAKRAGAAGVLALAAFAAFMMWRDHGAHGHLAHASLEAIEQTLLVAEAGSPVAIPALVQADGKPVSRQAFEGRWSLVFFGFTSCPDVCPTTLQVLGRLAGEPAQILVVTTDPANDTPERMRAYLAAFDPRIMGLTGSADSVAQLAQSMGAGFRDMPTGMDHSTSLFVVDPAARVAGVMLRPANASRIAADLALLRNAHVSPALPGR